MSGSCKSSLYPNQINNAVAFPGLLAGLMFAGARQLDIDVGVAAAQAIANRTEQLRRQDASFAEIVPKVVDCRLHLQVALATLENVYERGINRDPAAEATPPDRSEAVTEIERRYRVA